MGRARGENNLQVALNQRLVARGRVNDRFAAVLGTTRGSDRVELTPEQETAARDARLQRVIEANGAVRYCNHEGQLHRETGPAIEEANGTREWYQQGKRHREDGPAIKWPNRRREWYLNNARLTLPRLSWGSCFLPSHFGRVFGYCALLGD